MATRFGEKLAHLRRSAALTQQELVQDFGLSSQSHLSNIESGRRLPSVALVSQVAQLFRVSFEYLLRDSVAIDACLPVLPLPPVVPSPAFSLFGAKLRHLREQRGLRQVDLVRQLGVISPPHLTMIEKGQREPSLDLVLAIAVFFSVSLDYLLFDAIPVSEVTDSF